MNQAHKNSDGAFDVTSMLSDPDCATYSLQQRKEFGIPVGFPVLPPAPHPSRSTDEIIFVLDEDGNRTHRWHWGRGAWVALRH